MPPSKRRAAKLPNVLPASGKKMQQLRPTKSQGALLPLVRANLLRRVDADPRDHTVIHPSEVAKSGWCARDTWLRLVGAPGEERVFDSSTLLIFEEGTAIHEKYQFWFWEAGVLQGEYLCILCKWRGWATAPRRCPQCRARAYDYDGPLFLRYKEVPLRRPDLRIAGNADGLTDELLEIKSVGLGTIREENPALYQRYTSGELDLPKLFTNIRSPMVSHVRQGMLYAWLAGRDVMRYIYEWKPTQLVKEFEVRLNLDLLEDRIDRIKDINYALDNGRTVRRPKWADPEHKTCKKCEHNTACWSDTYEATRKTPVTFRVRRELPR
jgi:hypothetical protein